MASRRKGRVRKTRHRRGTRPSLKKLDERLRDDARRVLAEVRKTKDLLSKKDIMGRSGLTYNRVGNALAALQSAKFINSKRVSGRVVYGRK